MAAKSAKSIKPHHDPEHRELAYGWWAYKTSRNAEKVAELFADGTITGQPVDIPSRTIRYWSEADRWLARVEQEIVDSANDIGFQTRMDLVLAAHSAAGYIAGVANGTVEPDKLRLEAAKLALMSVGMLGGSSKDPLMALQRPNQSAELPDFSKMTDDQLAIEEAKLRNRRN